MRTVSMHTAHPRAELSLLWFEYLLYALVAPAFIGAAISWVKTRAYEAGGSQEDEPWSPEDLLLATHHVWLKRTFIAALLLCLVAIGTVNYGPGYAVAVGTAAWWVYRVVRGAAALAAGRPLPVLL